METSSSARLIEYTIPSTPRQQSPHERSPRRYSDTPIARGASSASLILERNARADFTVSKAKWRENIENGLARITKAKIREISRERNLTKFPVDEDFFMAMVREVLSNALQFSGINARVSKAIATHIKRPEYDYLRGFTSNNPLQFNSDYRNLSTEQQKSLLDIIGDKHALNIIKECVNRKKRKNLQNGLLSIAEKISMVESKVIVLNKTRFHFLKGFDFCLLNEITTPMYLVSLETIMNSFRAFWGGDNDSDHNAIIFNSFPLRLPDKKDYEKEKSHDVFFISWLIEQIAQQTGHENYAKDLKQQKKYFKKTVKLPDEHKNYLRKKLTKIFQSKWKKIANGGKESSVKSAQLEYYLNKSKEPKKPEIDAPFANAVKRHHQFLWQALETKDSSWCTSCRPKMRDELVSYCLDEIYPRLYAYDITTEIIPLRSMLALFNNTGMAIVQYFFQELCPSLVNQKDENNPYRLFSLSRQQDEQGFYSSEVSTRYELKYSELENSAEVTHIKMYAIKSESTHATLRVLWKPSLSMSDPFSISGDLNIEFAFQNDYPFDPHREKICEKFDFQKLKKGRFKDLIETKYVMESPRVPKSPFFK